MRSLLTLSCIALASAATLASAQNLTDSDIAQKILDDLQAANENSEPTNNLGRVVPRDYAQLRFLDRLNADVEVFELAAGQSVEKRHLNITLQSCFVPADNGASDAVAFLDIDDKREALPDFNGWMVASSPALNAMEHPRYDVWVISCSQGPKAGGLPGAVPDLPPDRPSDLPERPIDFDEDLSEDPVEDTSEELTDDLAEDLVEETTD